MAVLWGPKMPRKAEEGHVERWILYRYLRFMLSPGFWGSEITPDLVSYNATITACKESRLNRRWRLNHVVIGSVDLYMSFGPPKGSVLEGTSPHSRDPARLVNYYELARYIWVFPKMVVPNNHGVFLLKMIILGFCWGYPYFWKHPYTVLGGGFT